MEKIIVGIEFADAAAKNAMSAFVANAVKADSATKNLGDAGKTAFDKIALSIGKAVGVQDIFVGNLAANLATKFFDGIKNSMSQIIDEAAGSEQAIQNLNVALNTAGLYSETSSKNFQKLAGDIQNVTKYSDESVLSTVSLLASLTNLDEEGITKTTNAAVDLAATLQVDLSTATDMLVKALNGNTVAFSKQGIQIEAGANSAERLTNILQALASQQDTAKNQANSYAGATEKLKNQQSELFEALGKLYTQSDATISKTNAMASAYGAAAEFIGNNAQAIRDLGSAIAITAGIAGTAYLAYTVATSAVVVGNMAIIASSGLLAGSFTILSTAAVTAWAAITAPITLIVGAIALVTAGVYLLVKNWESVKSATLGALATMIDFAAASAEFVGLDIAGKLKATAQGYRDEAKAIQEGIAAREKAAQVESDEDKLKREQEEKRKARLQKEIEDITRHETFLRTNSSLNAQEIVRVEEEKEIKLAELRQLYRDQQILNDGLYTEDTLVKMQEQALLRLEQQQAFDQQELDLQLAKQMAKAQSEDDEIKRREAVNDQVQKAKLAKLNLIAKQELDVEKLKQENEKKIDGDRLKSRDNTLKLFASMSQSNNSVLASIGKAAGLTQIAIATPVAVAEATKFGLATGGPALGSLFGGIAYAAMAAQAAQLVGLQFANGGIVPGDSTSGDLVQARVNSGEMVLNKAQQTTLFDIANGRDRRNVQQGSNNNDLINEIRALRGDIGKQPISVSVDGREIVNVVRNQLASGRTI